MSKKQIAQPTAPPMAEVIDYRFRDRVRSTYLETKSVNYTARLLRMADDEVEAIVLDLLPQD